VLRVLALGYGKEILIGMLAHLLEADGENSWFDRSSNNFEVASVEAEEKPLLDSSRSSSFDYSRASLHTVESHKDLRSNSLTSCGDVLFVPSNDENSRKFISVSICAAGIRIKFPDLMNN
ncbi:hypothetical protein Dimus_031985, partial [Dionaea muscipula]